MRSPDPLRITFLLPHAGLSGGVRVVAMLAQRLHERGHRVIILSTPFRLFGIRQRLSNMWFRLRLWMKGEREPSHLNDIDVEHRLLPSPDWLNAADVPESDVVVATWWETAEALHNLPEPRGALAYFIQGYEAHGSQPAERVNATWRLPIQKIVVAKWLAEMARDKFGDATAALVPNSVDLEQFSVPPRSRHNPPSVGLVYSRHHFKGCDICVKAIEIARQSIPDLQVHAFGFPEHGEAALPAGAHYTVMPPQDQLKDIYSACDAWLFGSRQEGFGLPILEAMASRTPVIAAPGGAAPELLAGGGGVLVKPDDPEDMAAAIVRLMRMDEAQWQRLSDAAYATASRYTWDDATTLFEEALRKTIRRAAAGASAGGGHADARTRRGVDSLRVPAQAAGV